MQVIKVVPWIYTLSQCGGSHIKDILEQCAGIWLLSGSTMHVDAVCIILFKVPFCKLVAFGQKFEGVKG